MKTAHLINIFIVVFVDLLGFSLILPLLPYYAEKFGANPTIIGLLTASYAAASLLGTPLMGRLSDRFGRRPILLLSVAGTFVGFLFLGFAEPIGRGLANLIAPASANAFILGTLFFSRILDGITGGNITVAQAYISDITDESNRAKGLGLRRPRSGPGLWPWLYHWTGSRGTAQQMGLQCSGIPCRRIVVPEPAVHFLLPARVADGGTPYDDGPAEASSFHGQGAYCRAQPS